MEYIQASVEISYFDAEDVICTSNVSGNGIQLNEIP